MSQRERAIAIPLVPVSLRLRVAFPILPRRELVTYTRRETSMAIHIATRSDFIVSPSSGWNLIERGSAMALDFQGEPSIKAERNVNGSCFISITLQSTPASHPPSRSNKYVRTRVNVTECKLTLEIQMLITIRP